MVIILSYLRKKPEGWNLQLLLLAVLSFLFTFVPILLTLIAMIVLFTSYEVFLAIVLMLVSVGAFFISFVSIKSKSSTFYLFLYFGANAVIAGILSYFEPLYILVVIAEVYGMIFCVRITTPDRKFIPRFKSKRAISLALFGMVVISSPIFLYFFPPLIKYEVEPLDRNNHPIEFNFALANNSLLDDRLLDILQRANELPGASISIEAPVLEEFILNTTKLVGISVPNRDDYILSDSVYNSTTEYNEAINRYESAWRNVTKAVRFAVGNMSLEELKSLDDSYFDTSGILKNTTLTLYQMGIAVDFMPLLEKDVYINDKTIERINKTFTLFARWIEINHLEKVHRGVIFDTEMDWIIRYGVLKYYRDYRTHEAGVSILGDLIKMVKQWEWRWKGFEEKYGQYTPTKWMQYAAETGVTYVGSATFGMHLDDLWDGDDAEQNAVKTSILPDDSAEQFDYIGIMTYETGDNSEQAVYSYCRVGDFFFGNAAVPYIYSGMDDLAKYKDRPQSYIEEIARKFRIAINYGYDKVGIWALTHLYCFSEFGSGWCGGIYDFLKATWTPEALFWMIANLTSGESEPIFFTCKGYNFAWFHPLLTFLDFYLPSPLRYTSWPIGDRVRIRPENYVDATPMLNGVVAAATIVAVLGWFLIESRKRLGFLGKKCVE